MAAPGTQPIDSGPWPRSMPLADWQATRDTLHMWMQMVGKTRLALAPGQNHWWHVTLYVTARGLTSSPIPSGARTFEIDFDFIDHSLIVKTSDGAVRDIALSPDRRGFLSGVLALLASLGIAVKLWPVPTEADHTIPFTADRVHASYDAAQAHRFSRCCGRRIGSPSASRDGSRRRAPCTLLGRLRSRPHAIQRRRAPHKDTDSVDAP